MITEEEALKNCNNPNELALKLKGISATSDRTWQPVERRRARPRGASRPERRPVGAAAARTPDWMRRDWRHVPQGPDRQPR